MYTSKPFKIGDSELVFHSSKSSIYWWHGNHTSNIPFAVRGYGQGEYGYGGEPGRWYLYGSGFKRLVSDCPFGEKNPNLESLLETEFKKQSEVPNE